MAVARAAWISRSACRAATRSGCGWGPGGAFDTTRATDLIVGKTPINVVAGQLNADALPDLVVANAGDQTVSVLLGSAAGFGSAQSYPVGDKPTGIAIADLDGDRHADVVVTNRVGNALTILRGPATAS